MQELGYTREGDYYRVTGENTDRTVATRSLITGASFVKLDDVFAPTSSAGGGSSSDGGNTDNGGGNTSGGDDELDPLG